MKMQGVLASIGDHHTRLQVFVTSSVVCLVKTHGDYASQHEDTTRIVHAFSVKVIKGIKSKQPLWIVMQSVLSNLHNIGFLVGCSS